MIKRLLIVLFSVGLVALVAVPASAETGPFTLDGQTWCPSYQARNGCTTTQYPSQYTVGFSPSQVSVNGSSVDLTMDTTTDLAGAINNYGYSSEYITDNEEEWANLNVPCNASGQIENWPAFWLEGTVGNWPERGELDVMEGIHGKAEWHVWAENAAGTAAIDVGGTYTGSICGSHSYTVVRTPTSVSFYKDRALQGTVTSTRIPLASDPMQTLFGNEAGAAGGPTTNGAVMVVSGIGTYSG